MNRSFLTFLLASFVFFAGAQTHVSFSNLENWTCSELSQYVGQEVIFDQPIYICNNYRSTITASVHRQFSPTNQAEPATAAYNEIVNVNKSNTFTLTGLTGYHRMGETIHGLRARINSTSSVTCLSYDHIYGTRTDLEAGIPSVDLRLDAQADTFITHNLLVCAANLEYYLVEKFGTGSSTMGPADLTEHQKQRKKVNAALTKINADLYGLVEIQQGQNAISEIAEDLTNATGRQFEYITDGSSANGTYTKSGYVYCSDVLRPFGAIKENNQGVVQRKKLQAFEVIASGEKFIFSINHFKAKSSGGSGKDADQKDGQGGYNNTRTEEARSVLAAYSNNKTYYADDDILIMGDLNAYAKEDPITVFIQGGMTDLHRFFHADSSYSYTYHGQAGYLDHALCNSTLLPQVTGMAAYHINSDESDDYTYDKSSDATMFRCSDHDPILVGLKLGSRISTDLPPLLSVKDGELLIQAPEGGQYTIHTVDGLLLASGYLNAYTGPIPCPTTGMVIVKIYTAQTVYTYKQMIVK